MGFWNKFKKALNDNLFVLALVAGVVTGIGITLTALFPPGGIFLIGALAGCGVGLVLTGATTGAWIHQMGMDDQDNNENEKEVTPQPDEKYEEMNAKLDIVIQGQKAALLKDEDLKEKLNHIDKKADDAAELISLGLASIAEGQTEVVGAIHEMRGDISKHTYVSENRYTSFHHPSAIEGIFDPTQDESQRFLTS